MNFRAAWVACTLFCLSLLPAYGALVEYDGNWVDRRYAPSLSMPEHYDRGYQAFVEGNWDSALNDFIVITTHFLDSPFYSDALFYMGVCYFEMGELHFANKMFDFYLDLKGTLKHFETIFEYKFKIAERFGQGEKRHLFNQKLLPRISPGRKQALALYDEVIATLPNRELAAQSLYAKALLLRSRRDYREAIEILQTLSRRFPKHSLAAEGYLRISEIYLDEAIRESQNPDLLSHAQINLHRFQKDFPGDTRTAYVDECLKSMEEIFAKSLYDTGKFYEKKEKVRAAAIYYEEAVRRYPDTVAANSCRRRLPPKEVALSS